MVRWRVGAAAALLLVCGGRWATAAPAPGECTGAGDCALNGDCVRGRCACDAAWSGAPDCARLAFVPPRALDDTLAVANASAATWGGNSVWADGEWHMFHAQMANGCNLSSWTRNSVVARSTSRSRTGPYVFQEIVVNHFSHNPKVHRLHDGTFALFFIGGWATAADECRHGAGRVGPGDGEASTSTHTRTNLGAADACTQWAWPKTCGSAMRGPDGDTCGPEAQGGNGGCGLAVATAPSVRGPWNVSRIVIEDRWRSASFYCAFTNPSAVFHPPSDGGLVTMAFNAGFCNGGLESIGLARAPSLYGPWRLLVPEPFTGRQTEDPFLWRSKRGWHLMIHDFSKEVSLWFSADALTWTEARGAPYDCFVVLADGSRREFPGCGNRPQIEVDDLGVPVLLLHGALVPHGKVDSLLLARPLKQPVENVARL
jgi:hypothetical protein